MQSAPMTFESLTALENDSHEAFGCERSDNCPAAGTGGGLSAIESEDAFEFSAA